MKYWMLSTIEMKMASHQEYVCAFKMMGEENVPTTGVPCSWLSTATMLTFVDRNKCVLYCHAIKLN